MRLTFSLFFLSIALVAQAQYAKTADSTLNPNASKDSMRQAALEYAAILDSRVRQFSVTYTNQSYGKITGKNKDGQELYSGKMSTSQVNMNMNIPIIQNNKNSITLSVGSVHQFFNTKNMVDNTSQNLTSDIDDYIPMVNLALSYSRTMKLFGKDVYTVVSGSGIFSPDMSSHQYTLIGVATMPLVQKAYTRVSVGAVAMWNPASPFPFFLTFNYYHKFKNSNTELIVGIPSIVLRKELTPKASLSLRGDMVGNNSLFKMNTPVATFPSKLTYSTLDIKGGLLFEYRLTKKLMFSAGGGINANLRNRILENNKSINNYLINNTYKPTPYFQVGISMLPFWKGLGL